MFLMYAIVCGLSLDFEGVNKEGCKEFTYRQPFEGTEEECKLTLETQALQGLHMYLLTENQLNPVLMAYGCKPYGTEL